MRVGVLMGGWSSEREISLVSGRRVAGALRSKGYDVVEVDVQRDVVEKLTDLNIDIAFIMLHGKPGEDGIIQGLLEVMDIPYTGSDVLSSSLSMDKVMTKKVLNASGIPTPDYEYPVVKDNPSLDYPYLIKPVSEGSSVGISIVRNEDDYKRALEEVDGYGDFFAEEYINGVEITVGILGDMALPTLELVPKNEFYDYEAKYTEGMTEFIIPARLDAGIRERCKNIALETFRVLGCRDFGRVDFVVKEGEAYVLEVNTIPGMTELSDLPAEAEEIGIGYEELVDRILRLAADRI